MSLALLLLLFAQDVPLAGVAVPDAELAAQRGGFELPNGIDVALTVQTQTSLNGAIVLRTVFRADQGPATLTVYAPRAGETVAAARGAAGTNTVAMPTISYDSRSGLQVMPGAPTVAVTAGAAAAAHEAGLAQVANGAITDNGTIAQTLRGGVESTELRAYDLTISHLAGSAFGSAILNSGSDRAIDTQTTVGIELHNVGPTLLASAALRIEDVAIDAMAMRR